MGVGGELAGSTDEDASVEDGVARDGDGDGDGDVGDLAPIPECLFANRAASLIMLLGVPAYNNTTWISFVRRIDLLSVVLTTRERLLSKRAWSDELRWGVAGDASNPVELGKPADGPACPCQRIRSDQGRGQ